MRLLPHLLRQHGAARNPNVGATNKEETTMCARGAILCTVRVDEVSLSKGSALGTMTKKGK
jgi:hypothetical protein